MIKDVYASKNQDFASMKIEKDLKWALCRACRELSVDACIDGMHQKLTFEDRIQSNGEYEKSETKTVITRE